MKKSKSLLISICLVLITFNTSFSQSKKDIVFHLVENSNLYSAPSDTSSYVGSLKEYDNVVFVDSISVEWIQVKINNQTGYVQTKDIKPGKAVSSTFSYRTGARCKDGTSSSATGRGACSHHGGVSYWLTNTRTTYRIINN